MKGRARRRPARAVSRRELDRFYSALSALAREYQFRDRDTRWYEGLAVTECYTLEVLAERGALSVNAIAAELRLDKSGASRAVARLVQSGLVKRLADPTEHRAWRVVISAKGRATIDRMTGRVKQQVRPILGKLTVQQRRQLTAMLSQLADLTRARLRQSPNGSRSDAAAVSAAGGGR
jgi:DNA-binding MarR family transcriptional regulator